MLNPIDENLSASIARNIRKDIRTIAKQKIAIDIEFCKFVFYTKVAYVDLNPPTPFYEYCGYNSWKEYIEQEVQITIGKARKYSAIYYKYFVELKGIFDPVKHGLDIGKMELLLPIINEKNAKDLLLKARTASIEVLKALLAPVNTGKTISFRITSRDSSVINKALKKARKEWGDDLTDGQLFIAILSEFVGG